MKNVFKKFFLIPVGIAALMCFAACDEESIITPPKPTQPEPETEHTYSDKWSFNNDEHWHSATCDHPDEKADIEEHTFELNLAKSTVSCTQDGVAVYECKCGFSYRENEKAGHNIVYSEGKEATCTEDGATPRGECNRFDCDYVIESQVIPATGHKYSTAWAWDDENHWHNATCGHDLTTQPEAHVYGENSVCKCGRSIVEADSANFTYKKVGTEYVVTGVSASAQDAALFRIPATYKNLKVTGIADGAFANNTVVETVNIPVGITSIGREAFMGCTKLNTVNLPNGLTELGYSAFSGCSALKEISLPASVNEIGSFAFEKCVGLKTIELPTSVTSFGEQVFNGCTLLEKVTLPSGITKLGSNMFLNCTSLSAVTLPSGITNIGSQAFANCTSLTSVSIPSGVTFIGNSAFKNSGLTSVELPEAVSYLGAYAFKDCTALTSAKIPSTKITVTVSVKDGKNQYDVSGSGVTYTMGDWFSGCEALKELTIPFAGARMDSEIAVSTAFGYLFGTTAPKAANADKFEAVSVTTGTGEQAKTHTYYIPKTLAKVTVLGGTHAEWRDDVATQKTYTLPANAFSGCTMIKEIVLAAGVFDGDALEGWSGTLTKLPSSAE